MSNGGKRMSDTLYEGSGIFGHIPTAQEVEAKAFVMPRSMQQCGFWPAYACGLSDAGVPDARVFEIVIAGCKGEFAHNVEPVFFSELDDEESGDE